MDKPQPAHADDGQNTYVFERYIEAIDGESAGVSRFTDTYLSGKFICESKSHGEGRTAHSGDTKLFKAKSQAESYARNLPKTGPRPLFQMVINVGRVIALYAQFKNDDRSYAALP